MSGSRSSSGSSRASSFPIFNARDLADLSYKVSAGVFSSLSEIDCQNLIATEIAKRVLNIPEGSEIPQWAMDSVYKSIDDFMQKISEPGASYNGRYQLLVKILAGRASDLEQTGGVLVAQSYWDSEINGLKIENILRAEASLTDHENLPLLFLDLAKSIDSYLKVPSPEAKTKLLARQIGPFFKRFIAAENPEALDLSFLSAFLNLDLSVEQQSLSREQKSYFLAGRFLDGLGMLSVDDAQITSRIVGLQYTGQEGGFTPALDAKEEVKKLLLIDAEMYQAFSSNLNLVEGVLETLLKPAHSGFSGGYDLIAASHAIGNAILLMNEENHSALLNFIKTTPGVMAIFTAENSRQLLELDFGHIPV